MEKIPTNKPSLTKFSRAKRHLCLLFIISPPFYPTFLLSSTCAKILGKMKRLRLKKQTLVKMVLIVAAFSLVLSGVLPFLLIIFR